MAEAKAKDKAEDKAVVEDKAMVEDKAVVVLEDEATKQAAVVGEEAIDMLS
jgi:hypothetical protein